MSTDDHIYIEFTNPTPGTTRLSVRYGYYSLPMEQTYQRALTIGEQNMIGNVARNVVNHFVQLMKPLYTEIERLNNIAATKPAREPYPEPKVWRAGRRHYDMHWEK